MECTNALKDNELLCCFVGVHLSLRVRLKKLNVLRLSTDYNCLVKNPQLRLQPKTVNTMAEGIGLDLEKARLAGVEQFCFKGKRSS